MQLRQFVTALKEERDALLASYTCADSTTQVAQELREAGLTSEQLRHVVAALDTALTESFYTSLLALDGAASLDGAQRPYQILDEAGNVISAGDGSLEALAFDVFHSQP